MVHKDQPLKSSEQSVEVYIMDQKRKQKIPSTEAHHLTQAQCPKSAG